jgi:hypothetical protein
LLWVMMAEQNIVNCHNSAYKPSHLI